AIRCRTRYCSRGKLLKVLYLGASAPNRRIQIKQKSGITQGATPLCRKKERKLTDSDSPPGSRSSRAGGTWAARRQLFRRGNLRLTKPPRQYDWEIDRAGLADPLRLDPSRRLGEH